MSGFMDSIKSFFGWPIVTAFFYMRFSVGFLVCSGPFVFKLVTGHTDLLTDFTKMFQFFKRLPLGRYVFAGISGAFTPNNSFYAAVTTDLTPSKAECYQPDFPWYRNPFGCMHAVAIISLGELASGIAIVAALQRLKHLKGIPVKIEAKYYSKIRGTAYASADVSELSTISENGQHTFVTHIKNEKGVICADVSTTWDFKIKELIIKGK